MSMETTGTFCDAAKSSAGMIALLSFATTIRPLAPAPIRLRMSVICLPEVLVGVGRRQNVESRRLGGRHASGPAGSPRTATSETARNIRWSRRRHSPCRIPPSPSAASSLRPKSVRIPGDRTLSTDVRSSRGAAIQIFHSRSSLVRIFSLHRSVRLISSGLRPAVPPRESSIPSRSRRSPLPARKQPGCANRFKNTESDVASGKDVALRGSTKAADASRIRLEIDRFLAAT